MDEEDIKRAEIGATVIRYNGMEITTGRIKEFSPRRSSMTVAWDTGRESKVHHSRFGNITLADHRQTKRKG